MRENVKCVPLGLGEVRALNLEPLEVMPGPALVIVDINEFPMELP